jgi:hypothetical protein
VINQIGLHVSAILWWDSSILLRWAVSVSRNNSWCPLWLEPCVSLPNPGLIFSLEQPVTLVLFGNYWRQSIYAHDSVPYKLQLCVLALIHADWRNDTLVFFEQRTTHRYCRYHWVGSFKKFFQSLQILRDEVHNLWILNFQCLTGAGVDEPWVLWWQFAVYFASGSGALCGRQVWET